MKKILAVIFSILILTLCCACSNSKPTFEGEWYLYSNGSKCLIDNNKITVYTDNEKGITTTYSKKDNFIEAYLTPFFSARKGTYKLYIVKYENTYVLSTKEDTTGRLLFFKDKKIRDQYISNKLNQEEKIKIEKENNQLNYYRNVPLVTYDSLILGKHIDKTVALEAIVSDFKYEYDFFKFNCWFFSDINKNYEKMGPITIYPPLPSFKKNELVKLENGDKIKIVFNCTQKGDYGSLKYQYAEIIQKGNLKDYGITFDNNEKESIKDDYKSVSSSGSTSDLDISYTKDYIDGNNMYLKVYVKNNSFAMFKGDVHVFFYTADGKKRLGSDMIIIDKLMPGQTNWAKVKIDKYLGSPKIETEFTNPQFLDISPISTEIDNELSKKTTNSVRLNFDVASWYKNIKSIKVMTDRTCVVTSTSSKDNSTIASAVWSCGKDYGVKTVQVVDNEGNIKAVYP